jgi:hypothetical protein
MGLLAGRRLFDEFGKKFDKVGSGVAACRLAMNPACPHIERRIQR